MRVVWPWRPTNLKLSVICVHSAPIELEPQTPDPHPTLKQKRRQQPEKPKPNILSVVVESEPAAVMTRVQIATTCNHNKSRYIMRALSSTNCKQLRSGINSNDANANLPAFQLSSMQALSSSALAHGIRGVPSQLTRISFKGQGQESRSKKTGHKVWSLFLAGHFRGWVSFGTAFWCFVETESYYTHLGLRSECIAGSPRS